MRKQNIFVNCILVLVSIVGTMILTPSPLTSQTVLYSLGGPAGSFPYAGLVFDSVGNLYGTTTAGGNYQKGVVFELIPQGGSVWVERTRHNFGATSTDGTSPYGGLILDVQEIFMEPHTLVEPTVWVPSLS